MERIAIEDVQQRQQDVEVSLWGTEFEKVAATRKVGRQARELWEQIRAAEDDDAVIVLLGKLLDLRLKPAGKPATKASTLLKRKWEADEVDGAAVFTFMEELAATDRPT
jgi:hypothetical protein